VCANHQDPDRMAEFSRVKAALEAAECPSADFGRFTSGRIPDEIRPSVFDTRRAVPVLLALLPTVVHRDVLRAIVAHLASPAARPVAAEPLIALFRDWTDSYDSPVEWGIGNAISVVTTPDHVDDLLDLAQDPKHGRARQMIVERLGRISRDDRIVPLLRRLAVDPDVALHAMGGLRRRLGAADAADVIQPLLNHAADSVRQAAQQSMSKIRRSLK